MEPLDFLRIFRQRWKIIVASVLISAAIAWFTTPETAAQAGPTAPSYTATATLIQAPGSSLPPARTSRCWPRRETSPRPRRMRSATRVTRPRSPAASRSRPTPRWGRCRSPRTTRTARARRRSPTRTPRRSSRRSAKDAEAERQAQIDGLTASIKTIQTQLTPLQKQLAAKPSDVLLQAQVDAYNQQLKVAISQLVALYTQVGVGLTADRPAAGHAAAPRHHRFRGAAQPSWSSPAGDRRGPAPRPPARAARRPHRHEAAPTRGGRRSLPPARRRRGPARQSSRETAGPGGRHRRSRRSCRRGLPLAADRADDVAEPCDRRRHMGPGARRRAGSVDQEPRGRAGHVRQGRRGQDDHRGQPGRDPRRDRQAGPGDRRRLPQPVHAPHVRRLRRRRTRQPARARIGVRVRPRSARAAHRRHADQGADRRALRRVPRRPAHPHRGGGRGSPDVRRRRRHRRGPAAQQQRHAGLPSPTSTRSSSSPGSAASTGSRPVGSPTCSGAPGRPCSASCASGGDAGTATPTRGSAARGRRAHESVVAGARSTAGSRSSDRRDLRSRPRARCGAVRTCSGVPPAVTRCCSRPRQMSRWSSPAPEPRCGTCWPSRSRWTPWHSHWPVDTASSVETIRDDVERALAEMEAHGLLQGMG